ncbi:hypothetical protein [Methanolobus profundi]|uniref:Uncharacterized protein n=1 Tax=Methanolobus profundi TaxID=487685 RepID=A0A1I4RAC6_9EURY|nr:hypothetical protein [Methanolobus profundi]SFM48930.1 hypothetical protein SAMN04488696_1447 [Methanolobus profundi]
MEIMAFIGSAMLFATFAALVLFVLINMSSRLALLILFVTPVLIVLLIPEISIAFLSYQQMLLAEGLVPINNFHILLMLWSTLIGIVLYTEFLTWYLSKGRGMRKVRTGTGTGQKSNPFATFKENLAFAIEKAKEDMQNRK